jgi:hypothetical protein
MRHEHRRRNNGQKDLANPRSPKSTKVLPPAPLIIGLTIFSLRTLSTLQGVGVVKARKAGAGGLLGQTLPSPREEKVAREGRMRSG